MNNPINILVTGCNGRMGKAIIDCASNHDEVVISKGIDLGDSLDDHLDDCDIVIDFSTHSFQFRDMHKSIFENIFFNF